MTRATGLHQSRVRGACPGVERPMATGDGLLLRLPYPVGGWTPAQARALADCAERFGSGALELTVRANVQLRGVTTTRHGAARAALAEAGVIAPGGDPVAAIVTSAASDRDPTAIADPLPVARALRIRLRRRPDLARLPAKARQAVDGGGATALPPVPADLRLDAVTAADGYRYRITAASGSDQAQILGTVTAENAADCALALFQTLAALGAGTTAPRMQEALLTHGPTPFRGAAECAGAVPEVRPAADSTSPSTAQSLAGPPWVEAGIAFGALAPDQLRALADAAERHGSVDGPPPTLRPTHRRSLLLCDVEPAAAGTVAAHGAITAPDDPRWHLSACVGHPGCLSGTTATRADAADLDTVAPTLLAAGERLHVSGCDKGCGTPGTAAVTLIARDGAYAMTLAGNEAAEPDWPPASLAMVRHRIGALDALFAARRSGPNESLAELIRRLRRPEVIRFIEEYVDHV